MKKRVLMTTLALALTTAMLAGCGKQQEQPKTSEVQQISLGESRQDDVKETASVQETEESQEQEEPAEEMTAAQLKELYVDFLQGNSKAVNGKQGIEWLESGQTYSLDEMTQSFANWLLDDEVSYDILAASYGFIDCGVDGVPELVVRQEVSADWDVATLYTVLKYADGQLFAINGRYGYYRSYIEMNEYGYIIYGGSGGANVYYMEKSYLDKDGNEIFLYSEADEMGFDDAYISAYYFPNQVAPEGYPEDYELYSDDDDYITCVRYNLTQYSYDEVNGDAEYYRNYFFSFYDWDGNYYAPSEALAEMYNESGVKYYELHEAEQMVLDHETKLGVTDQIRDGGDVQWISLLEEH